MSRKFNTIKSFEFAFEGLKTAFKKEPNFRIHTMAGSLAIFFGVILKLTSTEMAIIVLTIGLVMILELINTMLEALVDIVSPAVHPKAKVAKDVSASAVLLSAIMAVLVAFFIFLPKLINLI